MTHLDPATNPPTTARPRGLVVIIIYKLGKGVLWLTLATALVVLMRLGLGERLLGLAEVLRLHAHAWSLELAALIVRADNPRVLWTVIAALLADGIASLIEGWALLYGRWWGPWLVVGTTSSLLPFEVAALAHDPHPVRVVILLVNTTIVVYLARRAMKAHRGP
jgi:uncharacterized membrane protein (DUF2068 family)